ncbi:Winged helix-turn-helix DNA-binding [Prevotella sp. tc2-28]|uniref:Fic family protein n=1 Tax=Prevotella sp. tc2-28 TaxID=1761888 RepID=UPI000895CC1E|nr:Fic family protein [Prevotella sp. tc2-28]SEA20561.1 Winged helix-turn-helix DNA-binding [Prevotella sp. tc2-28]
MFSPSYHLTPKAICLISEISEQVGILETLTENNSKTSGETLDPFQEDNLLREHEKLADGLSDGAGHYRTDDPHVRLHMSMLYDWLRNTDEHPLVIACIFHYELIEIHPFSEGNERLGLLWLTLLLTQWRPVLRGLSLEPIIVERQQEYRRILAYLGEIVKTSHFIEFILHCLLDIIAREVKNKVENKVKNKSREKVQDNSSKNALKEGAGATLSNSEQRVVKLLAEDPHITIGNLSRRLQLSEAGINKVLASLRKKEIIERIGANKNGSWKVNI